MWGALPLLPLLLLATVAPRGADAAAGWNDLNIVLVDGQWRQVAVAPGPGKPAPPRPRDDRWKFNDTSIIVLIASYREKRCPETLVSMVKNAAHPDRVLAGVVQQNSKMDEDCIAGYCKRMGAPLRVDESGGFYDANGCPHYANLRAIRLSDREAKGPVYARALQAKLVTPEEDFCMQIDAHTTFIEGWDVRILNEWGATENEYAVLSTYPTNAKDLHTNSNNHWEMPHLCHASLNGKGKVVNGRASAAANLERPLIAPLWAAGLSFSRCHAERNVPNDINLKSVFAGEEYGRGARLWSHGYDFYTISRPIIGTYYGSEKHGGGSGNFDATEAQESTERLATLLKWQGSDQSPEAVARLGFYGIGARRTMEQYAEWSGINTITGKVAKNCIVEYVPWSDQDAQQYVEYEPSGTEVVKDSSWRQRKKEAPKEGATKGSVFSSEKEKALLGNLFFLTLLVLVFVCGVGGYTLSNYKKIVKPRISKYSV